MIDLLFFTWTPLGMIMAFIYFMMRMPFIGINRIDFLVAFLGGPMTWVLGGMIGIAVYFRNLADIYDR